MSSVVMTILVKDSADSESLEKLVSEGATRMFPDAIEGRQLNYYKLSVPNDKVEEYTSRIKKDFAGILVAADVISKPTYF